MVSRSSTHQLETEFLEESTSTCLSFLRTGLCLPVVYEIQVELIVSRSTTDDSQYQDKCSNHE